MVELVIFGKPYPMSDHHIWQTQIQKDLDNKAVELTDKQRKSYELDFIAKAILKVPEQISDELQLSEFKKDTEELIAYLQTPAGDQKLSAKNYAGKLSAYKAMLMKKYKIVPNGYYMAVWMPLGVAIGLSIGIAMKNLALGLSLGLGLGLAIGAGINLKAQKEGKIL
jgi:hypothetical protein